MKFFFNSSDLDEALLAKKKFMDTYGQYNIDKADVIIPIGGDGFLLKSLHDYKNYKKPFYGINYGSIGFLMNNENSLDLVEIIRKSQKIKLFSSWSWTK